MTDQEFQEIMSAVAQGYQVYVPPKARSDFLKRQNGQVYLRSDGYVLGVSVPISTKPYRSIDDEWQ